MKKYLTLFLNFSLSLLSFFTVHACVSTDSPMAPSRVDARPPTTQEVVSIEELNKQLRERDEIIAFLQNYIQTDTYRDDVNLTDRDAVRDWLNSIRDELGFREPDFYQAIVVRDAGIEGLEIELESALDEIQRLRTNVGTVCNTDDIMEALDLGPSNIDSILVVYGDRYYSNEFEEIEWNLQDFRNSINNICD